MYQHYVIFQNVETYNLNIKNMCVFPTINNRISRDIVLKQNIHFLKLRNMLTSFVYVFKCESLNHLTCILAKYLND